MKLGKKLLALLLAAVLCFSLMPTVFADVTYEAKLSSQELTVSEEDQTVTVTVKGVAAFECDGFGAQAIVPDGLELVSITNTELTSGFDANAASGLFAMNADANFTLTEICVLTYKIPANTKAGTYVLGIEELEVTKDIFDTVTEGGVVTATLTIKGNNPVVPVESVSLDKTELKLAKGGNAKLTATVLPADATDKTVTWTTSKNKVATVAADGTVTAVGEGTAVITATAGGKTARCTVTVVNCLHTSKSLVAAKAATCTEKGNVAYKHCSTCGKNYDAEGKLLDTVETDALGHDMTFMTAVPATCNATGTKAYFHCERCTKNFVDKNGQGELTDLTTDKDPTNHAGGTELVNVKAPSHVNKEDGYTGDTKCLGCGEIIAKGETIPWGTHVWSDWKHDADKHWKECTVKGCTEKNEEAAHQPEAGTPNCVSSATCQVCGYEVAPTNSKIHTKIVKVEAKAATCTENGNIEHYKCTDCGKLFSDVAGATEIAAKDVVIPAAHKLTPVAEKPSTCRVNGTAAYDKCDVCGKMFDKDGKEITAPATLPLAAHTWDTTKWLANKDGHYRECKVCGIADTVITPHTPGAEATETTPQTCTDCGYIIKPATSHKEHTKGNLMSDATSHWYACTGCSEQLEKANHTVTSWTVDKAATTTEEGLRHGNCSVCQHVVYEKLAKINNTPTTPTKPGRPSGTKTVQSGKTFDAGVGVYVGLSILSLTGSAVVIGKKRKTR